MQWGVTLMISVQTALFFVRKEVLAHEIEAKRLHPWDDLQPYRYYLGTAFLLLLALILASFTLYTSARYRFYKKQLITNSPSGVQEHQGEPFTLLLIRFATVGLYFIFPLVDLFYRIYIEHIELKIHY